MDVIYKIRNKDGLFSNGKANIKDHKWTKKGKVWCSLKMVEKHIAAMFENKRRHKLYEDAVIVAYSTTELTVIEMGPILTQVEINGMHRILKNE